MNYTIFLIIMFIIFRIAFTCILLQTLLDDSIILPDSKVIRLVLLIIGLILPISTILSIGVYFLVLVLFHSIQTRFKRLRRCINKYLDVEEKDIVTKPIEISKRDKGSKNMLCYNCRFNTRTTNSRGWHDNCIHFGYGLTGEDIKEMLLHNKCREYDPYTNEELKQQEEWYRKHPNETV